MDVKAAAWRMAAQAGMIQAVLEGVDPVEARWQPGPGKWSILQVLRHLAHEEREDFRYWMEHLFAHPGTPCPPLRPAPDTEAWQREGDLETALLGFLQAREASVAWVLGREGADWGLRYREPDFQVSAGDLLVSWMGHDLVHLRQLVRLRWEYLPAALAPHAPTYNAEWPAAG